MTSPRIICFDLETLPNLPEALKIWPQLSNYPGLTLRATITSIICAGWKVHGQKKCNIINAWDFPEWKKDVNNDKKLVLALYEVLKTADAIVTQNGVRFDWPHFQTRLMYHGLDPLHDIPHIDTKKLAKRNLYSFNNRLGYLGEWLVGDKKLDHEGWELWVKVHQRDPKAMAKMAKYCIQDVNLLDKVFKKLKPFAKNIPNYNLYNRDGKNACPSCGGTRLQPNGYRHTKTQSYQRLICKDCGSSSRTDIQGRMPRSI